MLIHVEIAPELSSLVVCDSEVALSVEELPPLSNGGVSSSDRCPLVADCFLSDGLGQSLLLHIIIN